MSEIRVDDEEAFMGYAEKFVYDLQKAWAGKKGFEGYAVLDMCAKIEDFAYHSALHEYNLSPPATVWSKRECVDFYQGKCESLVRSLESAEVKGGWRKFIEDNKGDTGKVIRAILGTQGAGAGFGGAGRPRDPREHDDDAPRRKKRPSTDKPRGARQAGGAGRGPRRAAPLPLYRDGEGEAMSQGRNMGMSEGNMGIEDMQDMDTEMQVLGPEGDMGGGHGGFDGDDFELFDDLDEMG